MAWIEVHQSLPTNKKTLRLSSLLNISTREATGALIFIWLWAIDNAPDGDISCMKDKEIAMIAGQKSKPAYFVESLIQSGFLDENRVLHDWYEYAGRLVDKRKLDAERKRKIRLEKAMDGAEISAGHPQDIQRTAQDNPSDGACTVPNRTAPNTTEPIFTVPDAIKNEWNDYVASRIKNRKLMTNKAKQLALAQLQKLSSDTEVQKAILNQSTFNSWQGLFALKADTSKQTKAEDRILRAPEGERNVG